jgi:hypothetical protein
VGFSAALLGYAYRCGQEPIALYDRARCIEILTDGQDMNISEAEEYFEYNVAGAWVGDLTPMIAVVS